MVVISGRDFKKRYKQPVVKLLCADKIHNGFKFTMGLNVLKQSFNTEAICGPGGLYCCFEKDQNKWTDYGGKKMVLKCKVVFPDDAKIVLMSNKMKCDKFYLYDCSHIFSKRKLKTMVRSGGGGAKKASVAASKDPVDAICKKLARLEQGAISSDEEDQQGYEGIGKKLMDIDVRFIELIPPEFRTPKMYERLLMEIYVYPVPREVIKTDKMEMWYIARNSIEIPPKYQTFEAYLKLIEYNPNIIVNIPEKDQTKRLWKESMKDNGDRLCIVPEDKRDMELCEYAVSQRGFSLFFVPWQKRTEKICWKALEQDSQSVIWIPRFMLTKKMYKYVHKISRAKGLIIGSCDKYMDFRKMLDSVEQIPSSMEKPEPDIKLSSTIITGQMTSNQGMINPQPVLVN